MEKVEITRMGNIGRAKKTKNGTKFLVMASLGDSIWRQSKLDDFKE